jgi:hypothetical protein
MQRVRTAMQRVRTGTVCNPRQRKAAAILELAVCLPVIVTIVLGTIESANSIFLKQSLTIAAYESARVATAPGGTYKGAQRRATEIMNARGLRTFQFRITPRAVDRVSSGVELRVTITTRANANSISPSWYSKEAKMSATMRMIKL